MDVLFLDKDPHEVDDLRQVEQDKEATKSREKGKREQKMSVMQNKSEDGDVREVGEPIRRLVDVSSVDRIGKFCVPMREYGCLRKMIYEGTNY